jgi:membrane-bound serine protease (ClpP class)
MLATAGAAQGTRGPVLVAELRGVVNPVMASYVDRVITEAEASGATMVVFALDTPGGLDTSMREINQRILRSTIPIGVFVWPHGARAASAGLFITYASHVAAMSPSTNIGSAHPVNLGGENEQQNDSVMLEKVTNDAVAGIRSLAELRGRNADWAEQAIRESKNLQASEALRMQVVDYVAQDVSDLLRQADGKTVRLSTGEVRLALRDVATEPVEMNPIERLLHVISDPTVAYLLLSLGGLALVYELSNPSAILPGVVGMIALLLALYALGTLPVNVAGVGLVLFALMLFFIELAFTNSGILTIGGIVSFALGSLLLATAPESQAYLRVSPAAAVAMVLVMAVFFGWVAVAILRVHYRQPFAGREALIGETGVTRTDVAEHGTVLVAGELWQASAANPIASGNRVKVVSVDGLHLTVQPE